MHFLCQFEFPHTTAKLAFQTYSSYRFWWFSNFQMLRGFNCNQGSFPLFRKPCCLFFWLLSQQLSYFDSLFFCSLIPHHPPLYSYHSLAPSCFSPKRPKISSNTWYFPFFLLLTTHWWQLTDSFNCQTIAKDKMQQAQKHGGLSFCIRDCQWKPSFDITEGLSH